MTNAEIIQAIKAEIERRIEHHDLLASNAESEMIANLEIGAAQALDDILPFLSTLESEKPNGPTIEEPIDGVLYAAACGIKNTTEKSEERS